MVLATFPLATVIFKSSIADGLLNCLLALVFFDLYRQLHAPQPRRLLRISVLMGLGFLTKGPVILVLPLGTAFFYCLWEKRLIDWWRACIHPFSWVPFLLVITPWHVASYLDQGWAFFEGFYLGHNLGRFSETMESHGGNPFYYIVLLPILLAPVTGLVIQHFSTLKNNLSPLNKYLLVWFSLTLTLFSFSSTQLPHYLLYGLTPLLIFAADQFNSMKKWHLWLALFFTVLVCAIPFALPHAAEITRNEYDKAVIILGAELFEQQFMWPSLAALAVSVAILFARTSLQQRFILLSLCLIGTLNFITLPIVALAQQQPVREAANIANSFPDRELVAFSINMPSFSVYTQRIVKREASPKVGQIVYTRAHRLDALQQSVGDSPLLVLYQRGGIALVSIEQKLK